MKFTSEQITGAIEVDENCESTLHSKEIIGHIFNSCEGNQLAHWICLKDIYSEEHCHDFDEYFAVIQGHYVLSINDIEICLQAGDEFLIPAGTPHSGRMCTGTSIFHIFGGHRPVTFP